jgi:hypothetical protein
MVMLDDRSLPTGECARSPEARFAADMDVVRASILESVPGVRAIVLYGGYGRGEGAWVVDPRGCYHPYNDYDLLLIVDVPAPSAQIRSLRAELARRIGIRWVDIGQTDLASLGRLKPSIYAHDLRNGSCVVYGDPGVVAAVPDRQSGEVPLQDIEVLFFTRLWTLLGSLGESGLSVERSGEDAMFFRNQMAKAVLAIVDVLLIREGAYHSSYRTRVERVAASPRSSHELIELSRWALEQKLCPSGQLISPAEGLALYESVHDHYFREMYSGLALYYARSISDPADVEHQLLRTPRGLLKTWAAPFFARGRRRKRKILVNLAQLYIAAAFQAERRRDRLQRGSDLLRQLSGDVAGKLTWDEARWTAARLRMEI